MPKKRTPKVENIKEILKQKTLSGYYYPGDRFFSNRAVASRYGISYQTAHRLMKELENEGYLKRRFKSGTYLSGTKQKLEGAVICFNSRAEIADSFGKRLFTGLTEALDSEHIYWESLAGCEKKLPADLYPVIWECPKIQEEALRENRFSLILNDRSRPGLASSLIDSIAMDNFSGGMAAGELIQTCFPGLNGGKSVFVFSGPSSDQRNIRRKEGFKSIFPESVDISADSWFYTDAEKAAPILAESNPTAVFCCNDRLASALINHYLKEGKPLPSIIGFDNAPVSENMDFSTIAIPWEDLIQLAVKIIRERITGNTGSTLHYELNPRPVLRGAFLKG